MVNNHLSAILDAWSAAPGEDWVLATVYRTQGSAYRKAGAWGLFNGLGQRHGLLSGGCLESDIHRQARRVMHTGKAMTVRYDTADDGSLLPATGCGGTVDILLQPVTEADDLGLTALHRSLQMRQSGWYYQRIPGPDGEVAARFEPADSVEGRARLREMDGNTWLVSPVKPAFHLLVVGGGADARPLVAMAKLLGWRVSLCDPRPANARPEHFPDVDITLRELDQTLRDYLHKTPADGAVLMTHSLELDARALASLQHCGLRYMALLGPRHRREEVTAEAGLIDAELVPPLHGPAGLDIGADLPETIALSILAEAQAVLSGRAAASLSRPEADRLQASCA